ncbi:uncharacterized protein LOC143593560 [Bidens hawaiensis]|uniref:uncharacterized protein LOC143593560 n=1 Tax=Bidens hawaiensis TaxID=980011 RepID=UPI00404AC437
MICWDWQLVYAHDKGKETHSILPALQHYDIPAFQKLQSDVENDGTSFRSWLKKTKGNTKKGNNMGGNKDGVVDDPVDEEVRVDAVGDVEVEGNDNREAGVDAMEDAEGGVFIVPEVNEEEERIDIIACDANDGMVSMGTDEGNGIATQEAENVIERLIELGYSENTPPCVSRLIKPQNAKEWEGLIEVKIIQFDDFVDYVEEIIKEAISKYEGEEGVRQAKLKWESRLTRYANKHESSTGGDGVKVRETLSKEKDPVSEAEKTQCLRPHKLVALWLSTLTE